jgi:hypothetical protein
MPGKASETVAKEKCAFREATSKFSRGSRGDLKTSTRTNNHSQEMEAASQLIRRNNNWQLSRKCKSANGRFWYLIC